LISQARQGDGDVALGHVDSTSLPSGGHPRRDLCVFSSPGRMGRPIGGMRRLLKHLRLPAGTPYVLLVTELRPQPDPKTGGLTIGWQGKVAAFAAHIPAHVAVG
jgi:hypothetical protein